MVRLQGASLVGFLAILAAAWGGIAVFWGPNFQYFPTSTTAWQWTTQNWLLHVIPGAVGVGAGLMVLGLSPARRAGAGAIMALPSLLLIAAGAWFVIGPAAWATFESGTAFTTGESAMRTFADQAGSSLGPGVLLAIFGGMALKAGIFRPAVVERTAMPEAAGATARPAAMSETESPSTSAAPAAEPAAGPVTRTEPAVEGGSAPTTAKPEAS